MAGGKGGGGGGNIMVNGTSFLITRPRWK